MRPNRAAGPPLLQAAFDGKIPRFGIFSSGEEKCMKSQGNIIFPTESWDLPDVGVD